MDNSLPTIPVVLIPWDFASPDHVDRMFNQRKACGRGSEEVESWRRQQDVGALCLYWIVSPFTEVGTDGEPELAADEMKSRCWTMQ